MTQASGRWVAVCSEPVLVQQSVPLPAEALVPLLGPLPAARLARLRARLRHHPRRNIHHHRNIRHRDTQRRDTHRRRTIGKQYFAPVKSKEIRLEACVPLFANERVWAPDIKWAETVINEVASAPRGKYNDLCDTASAALLYLRDNNMLSLGDEFRREERRKSLFRGNKERGGTSIRERYET